MRDDNEQAIAPLPDAPRKSRAQMTLLNQAMREDELSRKAASRASVRTARSRVPSGRMSTGPKGPFFMELKWTTH
jgi:hypothetical protein